MTRPRLCSALVTLAMTSALSACADVPLGDLESSSESLIPAAVSQPQQGGECDPDAGVPHVEVAIEGPVPVPDHIYMEPEDIPVRVTATPLCEEATVNTLSLSLTGPHTERVLYDGSDDTYEGVIPVGSLAPGHYVLEAFAGDEAMPSAGGYSNRLFSVMNLEIGPDSPEAVLTWSRVSIPVLNGAVRIPYVLLSAEGSSDPDGLSRIEFFRDRRKVQSSSTTAMVYDTGAPFRAHLRLIDNQGNAALVYTDVPARTP